MQPHPPARTSRAKRQLPPDVLRVQNSFIAKQRRVPVGSAHQYSSSPSEIRQRKYLSFRPKSLRRRTLRPATPHHSNHKQRNGSLDHHGCTAHIMLLKPQRYMVRCMVASASKFACCTVGTAGSQNQCPQSTLCHQHFNEEAVRGKSTNQ